MAHIKINDITPRIQYTATSGQTVFPYPFPIFADGDLVVDINGSAQALTTDYTVSGAGTDNGGDVTLTTGANAGDIVTIYRDVPIERTTDYQIAGDFRPDTVNTDFDRIIAMMQQNERDIGRSLRIDVADTTTPSSLVIPGISDRANKFLSFDSSGAVQATSDPVGIDGDFSSVSNYTALRLLTPTVNGEMALVAGRALEDDGGGGIFIWRSGDQSTNVTNDPGEGIWVAPNSDSTGASGAWQRLRSGNEPYYIEQFGGGISKADNAAATNNAMTYFAFIGGGELRFSEAGTYELQEQGASPQKGSHRYCIDVIADNTIIYIAKGATLKLANGQQTDANGAVDIITWGANRSNVEIGGGGSITGNTAGQTGWTGGYAQNANGNIIESRGGGDSNITISDLTLEDHFSNPVNLGLGATPRLSNVKLLNLTTKNTGEGVQVIECDHLIYDGITHILDNGMVSAGDAIEVAECKYFIISNIGVVVTSGTGAGAAIDVFASKNGVVDGFSIDGWNSGVSASSSGSGVTTDDVVAGNGVMANLTGTTSLEPAEGFLVYHDITLENSANAFLFQVNDNDNTRPPIVLENCTSRNSQGIQITGNRKFVYRGGTITGTGTAIAMSRQSTSGDAMNVEISDIDARGNTTRGLSISDSGIGTCAPTGKITNLESDQAHDFVNTGSLDLSGLRMTNCEPSILTGVGLSPADDVASYEIVEAASGSNRSTLASPSKDQVVTIQATGALTLLDKSDASGDNLNLSGSANFGMTAGDTITLRYRTSDSQWYELSRSVN